MKKEILAFALAAGAASAGYATNDHPPRPPGDRVDVDVNNTDNTSIYNLVDNRNGGNRVVFGDGTLSPRSTSRSTSTASSTSGAVIEQGAVQQEIAMRAGDVNFTNREAANTAGTPGLYQAAGHSCFGASLSFSFGLASIGRNGGFGIALPQSWNKDCDESGDRARFMTSPNADERATGVAASIETFPRIGAGFERVSQANDAYYKETLPNGETRDLPFPKSGVGLLLGRKGYPDAVSREVVNGGAPRQHQEVNVYNVGGQTYTCPNGTKLNLQTLKCEGN